MTVSGVSGSNNSNTSLAGNGQAIAGNFDTFLSLLTTQLQNQDPLDPLDTNQFTQQLVEFSGVEQQLQTNSYLQTLVQSTQNSQNNAAVSYIGKDVTSSGVDADLTNGQASWSFDLAQDANVNVTVKDANGNQVYTESGSVSAGIGQFNWDGVGTDGTTEPSGTYSISITAKNSSGQYVDVSTQTSGVVTGVDLSGSEPSLIVGSQKIKLSDVLSVVQQASNDTGSSSGSSSGTGS